MDIINQKFLVLGVSKSGHAVASYLIKNKAKCYIYEELKIKGAIEAVKELTQKGAILVSDNDIDEVLKTIDVLIISPGVPINHKIALKSKELKIRIIGEFEFGFLTFNPRCIAVTGTNGKTTTVSMIKHVLNNANMLSALVGNVGIPVTSKLEEINKDTVCVCEVSSFQLETTSVFCPHVACVLNITPDHLDRHYTFENYVYLKNRLLSSQKESEYAVLNYDDLIVKNMAETAKGRVIYVSVKEKIDGAYQKDNALYFFDEKIISVDELSLSGLHNVYNALFTIASCKILGVQTEVLKNALKTFKGVPHRIELVDEINGVTYYNDSKSTNTNSTITAIKSMKKPTVLILGGAEKGEEYSELFKEIKKSKVIHTVITGASRLKMLRCALDNEITDITLVPNFLLAVKSAKAIAKNGENVLFSPACSSFDEFSNFEERGNAFKIAVCEEN